MSKTRVGVLRGGVGHEYDVSLSTGAGVLKTLSRDKYEPVDLLITKNGDWHVHGVPVIPGALPKYVDVVFNALHGEFGEDGQVQKVLDTIGIPYTGSGHYASAVSINKTQTNAILKNKGLKVPHNISFAFDGREVDDYAREVFLKVSPPWIVKPADRGSSVGITVVKHFPDLADAIAKAFTVSDYVLVEEYIKGKEATCGVINNFRGQAQYALPPIEIRRPGESAFWNYDDKYSGVTQEICPGNFTAEEKKQMEDIAVMVHDYLDLRHYSRTDFILSPRGIYVLETNTLPGLTPNSTLPKALEAVGCSYSDFLDHLIVLALNK
ncbi:MAG: D-alanine--D-alanine ligase [Candidatus Vogelbacteria bacterium]|nr:D-alanine--D-alanine ligase [Candidatus Vogelbacteria bacterium]